MISAIEGYLGNRSGLSAADADKINVASRMCGARAYLRLLEDPGLTWDLSWAKMANKTMITTKCKDVGNRSVAVLLFQDAVDRRQLTALHVRSQARLRGHGAAIVRCAKVDQSDETWLKPIKASLSFPDDCEFFYFLVHNSFRCDPADLKSMAEASSIVFTWDVDDQLFGMGAFLQWLEAAIKIAKGTSGCEDNAEEMIAIMNKRCAEVMQSPHMVEWDLVTGRPLNVPSHLYKALMDHQHSSRR